MGLPMPGRWARFRRAPAGSCRLPGLRSLLFSGASHPGEKVGGFLGRVGRPPQLGASSLRQNARTLSNFQQAVPSPTDGDEPGARRLDARRKRGSRRPHRPAVKPGRRRERVVVATLPVLRPVLEHVKKGGPSLSRGAQLMGMVPIREDAAVSAQGPVHCARHAHRQTLHPAREGTRVTGFDDEMQMVRLDGEVNDAKSTLVPVGKSQAQGAEYSLVAPEAREPGTGPHRDMDWVVAPVSGPFSMRNTDASPRWLSTRTGASAAMSPRNAKRQLLGSFARLFRASRGSGARPTPSAGSKRGGPVRRSVHSRDAYGDGHLRDPNLLSIPHPAHRQSAGSVARPDSGTQEQPRRGSRGQVRFARGIACEPSAGWYRQTR
jgi:hypothetical protein